MDIVFTRSTDRSDEAVVTRQDGVRLSVPVYGPLDPIPHDLAHYIMEIEMGLKDGFWASVAAGAIFDGMQIIAGRQRLHAAERSQAVLAANRQGIGLAEVMVGAMMLAVKGGNLYDAPMPIDSPVARTRAERDALIQRIRPAVEAMCARWRAIPMGGTLRVEWPDQPLHSHRDAHQQASHRRNRSQIRRRTRRSNYA